MSGRVKQSKLASHYARLPILHICSIISAAFGFCVCMYAACMDICAYLWLHCLLMQSFPAWFFFFFLGLGKIFYMRCSARWERDREGQASFIAFADDGQQLAGGGRRTDFRAAAGLSVLFGPGACCSGGCRRCWLHVGIFTSVFECASSGDKCESERVFSQHEHDAINWAQFLEVALLCCSQQKIDECFGWWLQYFFIYFGTCTLRFL